MRTLHTVLLFTAACRGPQGDVGPAGPRGPEGAPGPAGSDAEVHGLAWHDLDGQRVTLGAEPVVTDAHGIVWRLDVEQGRPVPAFDFDDVPWLYEDPACDGERWAAAAVSPLHGVLVDGQPRARAIDALAARICPASIDNGQGCEEYRGPCSLLISIDAMEPIAGPPIARFPPPLRLVAF